MFALRHRPWQCGAGTLFAAWECLSVSNNPLRSSRQAVPTLSSSQSRWSTPRWLAALVLLQVPLLGHEPLVRDEVQSDEAARKTLGALWSALHHLDAPLGLYYGFLHFWIKVSDSALWLRLPSLLAMAGAVAVAIWTAERMGGSRSGLVTGLLLLANPATWYFAADARPYALALLCAAVTLWIVLTAQHHSVVLFAFATLTVYLQGLFSLLLVVEALWLLRARQKRSLVALVASLVVWFPMAIASSSESMMTSWIPHTSPLSLAEAVHELFGSAGLLSGVAALVWIATAVVTRPRADLRRVLLLALVPAVVLASAGIVMHVLGGRYVLYVILIVAVVLGAAAGGTTDSREGVVRLVLGALVLLTVANVTVRALTPYTQDDLPAAAAWLVAHDQPGDGLLYSPDHARAAMLPDLQAASPRVADQDVSADDSQDRRHLGSFYLPERSSNQIEQALQTHTRVWVIGYPNDAWRPTPNTGGDIASRDLRSWRLTTTRIFGQIRLQLYTAP